MADVDELDSAILRELQLDARQTNREVARKLGIAASTCLERVRSLRRRGVITGFHASVSLSALDRKVQALLAVQVRPLSRQVIQGFKQYASSLPEVLSVYVVAGGDDFLVHVAVRDVEHLHAFLMDKVSKRREIVSFRSSIIYEHSGNVLVAPIDEEIRPVD